MKFYVSQTGEPFLDHSKNNLHLAPHLYVNENEKWGKIDLTTWPCLIFTVAPQTCWKMYDPTFWMEVSLPEGIEVI